MTTLIEDLATTLWLTRAAARSGVEAHNRLQAAKTAAGETMHRHEPIAEPIARPAVARRARTLTEAVRAYADQQARDSIATADPSHGIAQSIAIEAAADRELLSVSMIAEWIAGARKDGATTDAAIAARLVSLGCRVTL